MTNKEMMEDDLWQLCLQAAIAQKREVHFIISNGCRLSFSVAGKGGQLLSVSPEVNWISSFLALASAQILSSLGVRPVHAVFLFT